VEPVRDTKSISHEQTYASDLVDRAEVRREAVRMSDAVAARLRDAGLAGRTVTVKVRFHDFSTITRSHTVAVPVDEGTVIARAAVELLEAVDPTAGVRLLGVGVSGLTPARQLSFDDEGWSAATGAVDEIRHRFGDDAVGPASLLSERGIAVKRRGEQQWGPNQ
jgi:DNA polymerase-4